MQGRGWSIGGTAMSRKARRQNRQKRQRRGPSSPGASTRSNVVVPRPVSGNDRFVQVAELAEWFSVTPAAVRQWGRHGKLPLRRLFGDTGPLGMSESAALAIIRGETNGGEHGKPES